jgi:hypothetical protein
MKRLAWLLAACGGSPAVMPDAPVPCVAHFTGNFAETATADACATLSGGTLTLTMPSSTLGTTLVATIDLSTAPTPGAYTPATVASWSVIATQMVVGGECMYQAGGSATPQGSFSLALDSLAPHGTLDATQYILAFPDCGGSDTEMLTISF